MTFQEIKEAVKLDNLIDPIDFSSGIQSSMQLLEMDNFFITEKNLLIIAFHLRILKTWHTVNYSDSESEEIEDSSSMEVNLINVESNGEKLRLLSSQIIELESTIENIITAS